MWSRVYLRQGLVEQGMYRKQENSHLGEAWIIIFMYMKYLEKAHKRLAYLFIPSVSIHLKHMYIYLLNSLNQTVIVLTPWGLVA